MEQSTTNNFNQNIENFPIVERKILALDSSYKWKKIWKIIDIYFYCAICISFALFLISAIFFSLQRNFNLIKNLGMIFGFLSLGILAVSWMLIIFFKGPIKFINHSQKQLEELHKKQNKIMIIFRIIFFSLTTIPTFMLIIACIIIAHYYIACLITIYISFFLFIAFGSGAIILYANYLKNKKMMHECVISNMF